MANSFASSRCWFILCSLRFACLALSHIRAAWELGGTHPLRFRGMRMFRWDYRLALAAAVQVGRDRKACGKPLIDAIGKETWVPSLTTRADLAKPLRSSSKAGKARRLQRYSQPRRKGKRPMRTVRCDPALHRLENPLVGALLLNIST